MRLALRAALANCVIHKMCAKITKPSKSLRWPYSMLCLLFSLVIVTIVMVVVEGSKWPSGRDEERDHAVSTLKLLMLLKLKEELNKLEGWKCFIRDEYLTVFKVSSLICISIFLWYRFEQQLQDIFILLILLECLFVDWEAPCSIPGKREEPKSLKLELTATQRSTQH